MVNDAQVIANLDVELHRYRDAIRAAQKRKDSRSVDKAKARVDELLDARLTLEHSCTPST